MKLNCITLNGENNKKAIKKLKKDEVLPWMNKYCSTSRTIWRGCWFFGFLSSLTNDLVNEKELKASKIAVKAYNYALAPHHPWALKKAAGIAMKAIKAREKFQKSICEQQAKETGAEYVEENFFADIGAISILTEKLEKQMTAYCKENGFDKLP